MTGTVMDILILRLQAPLMAFGGPMIDQNGPTGRFPGLSQLAGLLGNALGWRHGDAAALTRLQARLRPLCLELGTTGERLTDFQTVDLGLPFMNGTGWTTRGRREGRGSGAATRETHIRLRDYRVETTVIVLLRLLDADELPTVADLLAALRQPARPLFIGRKPCLPSDFIGVGTVQAVTLFAAAQTLLSQGLPPQPHESAAARWTALDAQWPEDEPGAGTFSHREAVFDRRDWRNQSHGGERIVHQGRLNRTDSL
ncbi:MAG: type I-E CRISPR-associated protein Cas5/CasD [Azospirillaceae bacterium]|nr:type I-E CRISPR-associated protein Cas5/CasD [Azospirillaceae bacterium]